MSPNDNILSEDNAFGVLGPSLVKMGLSMKKVSSPVGLLTSLKMVLKKFEFERG